VNIQSKHSPMHDQILPSPSWSVTAHQWKSAAWNISHLESRAVSIRRCTSPIYRFPRHASLVDCTSLVVHPSLSVLHIHTLVTRYSLLNGGIITSKWYLWICVTNINLRITVKWIYFKVNRTDFLAHLSLTLALGRVLLARSEQK